MSLIVLLLLVLAEPGFASQPVALPVQYWSNWRADVDHLMDPEEKEQFSLLVGDSEPSSESFEGALFRFADSFWNRRDPTPGTPRNEAREAFNRLLSRVRLAYPEASDPRAKAILEHGWPIYRKSFGDCGGNEGNDVQVWYSPGDNRNSCTLPHMDLLFFDGGESSGPLPIVFYQRDGVCRRLKRGEPLIPGGVSNALLLSRLEREGCFESAPGYREYLERALADIPSEQEVIEARLELPVVRQVREEPRLSSQAVLARVRDSARFETLWRSIGKREVTNPLLPSTTVVKPYALGTAILHLETSAFPPWPADLPWRTFSVRADLLDMERGTVTPFAFDTNVFDRSRESIDLAFDIEARNGPHQLLVHLFEGSFVVPLAFEISVPGELDGAGRESGVGDASADLLSVIGDAPSVRLSEDQFAGLVTGKSEVEVTTTGAVELVEYRLGDLVAATSSERPFRVQIDFGDVPTMKTLTVVAKGESGVVVATDRVTVNTGAQRFDARMLDTHAVMSSSDSGRVLVRPRLQISTPEGRRVDRVEFFLGDLSVGTLFQPPFVQTLEVNERDGPTVVRAVVHLDDGRQLEVAELLDPRAGVRLNDEVAVDLVEVFASVTGRGGKAVLDLRIEEIEVREDGQEQEILEFHHVRNLPVNVVLLLDTSTSMAKHARLVKDAASRFLSGVVSDKDQAALIQFDTVPRIVVPLTSDRNRLSQASELLWVNGGTAFRDSVVTSLHYLSGIRGRRALVVLTDGIDEHSLLTSHQALEYAQHAGIAVYTVGLSMVGSLYAQPADGSPASFLERRDAERALLNLARGTGGLAFQASGPKELPEIYQRIEEDLRHQVLVTYQSPQQGSGFRRFDVRVHRPKTKVRTATGYYP